MSKTCLLIAGGTFSTRIPDKSPDLIIAVDKGLSYAERLGLQPDVVIGDFDSYTDNPFFPQREQDEPYPGRKDLSPFEIEVREEKTTLTDAGKELHLIRLYKKKDDSDTIAAIRYALHAGCTQLSLCCIMGGRFDHMTANLQAAAFAAQHGCIVRLYGDTDEICVFHNTTARFPKKEGWSLSAFSLSDISTGIQIQGTLYPASDLTLTNNMPLGLSNEWQDEEAAFSVTEGTLAVVMSKLPD